VWIPALIATLIFFGLPIAWAQRRAKQGLSGDEQGEMVVGAVSAIIAIGAALLMLWWEPKYRENATWWEQHHPEDAASFATAFATDVAFVAIFAFVAIATGTLAAGLAFWRGRARRAFIRKVEAGEIAGYRVDADIVDKVLVRVAPPSEGYRDTNFEEPIIMLDELGNAQHPLASTPAKNSSSLTSV